MMSMFKAKGSIGLDIGAGSIKMVELRRKGEAIELVKACLVEIPIDPANKKANRQQVVREALRKVLDQGAKGKLVAIATPSQSVYIRYLKLPPVDVSRINQIINYEAQQQIPIPIQEVIWDYQILRSKDISETKVALVAMKTELVNDLLSQVRAWQVEPEVIDYNPFASYNCLKFNQQLMDEETSVLMGIGASSTNLSIEWEGSLCWTRSIPLGGNDITAAIQKKFDLGFAQAEKLKRDDAVDGGVQEAIGGLLTRLVNQVERSLTFFRAEMGGTTINQVLLTGGGAKFTNLDKFLESKLGVKVKMASPLKNIVLSNGFDYPGQEVSFAVAIGLALRPLTRCASQISLLPLDLAKKKEFQKKRGHFILSFILALLIAVTAYAFSVQDYNIKKNRLGDIKRELEKFREYGEEIKPLQAEKNLVMEKLKVMRNLTERRSFWLEVLLELSRVTPQAINLTRFSPQGAILTLEGKASTIPDIIDFVSSLEASPLFGKVEAGAPERATGSEEEFYQFTLQVPLEKVQAMGLEKPAGRVEEADMVKSQRRQMEMRRDVRGVERYR